MYGIYTCIHSYPTQRPNIPFRGNMWWFKDFLFQSMVLRSFNCGQRPFFSQWIMVKGSTPIPITQKVLLMVFHILFFPMGWWGLLGLLRWRVRRRACHKRKLLKWLKLMKEWVIPPWLHADKGMGHSTMGKIQQGNGSVHHGYMPTREWISQPWVHANNGRSNKLYTSVYSGIYTTLYTSIILVYTVVYILYILVYNSNIH